MNELPVELYYLEAVIYLYIHPFAHINPTTEVYLRATIITYSLESLG